MEGEGRLGRSSQGAGCSQSRRGGKARRAHVIGALSTWLFGCEGPHSCREELGCTMNPLRRIQKEIADIQSDRESSLTIEALDGEPVDGWAG